MLGGSNGRARSNRRAKGPARAIIRPLRAWPGRWQGQGPPQHDKTRHRDQSLAGTGQQPRSRPNGAGTGNASLLCAGTGDVELYPQTLRAPACTLRPIAPPLTVCLSHIALSHIAPQRWATRCAERLGRLCRVVQSNQTSMDLCFKTDSLREDDKPKA